MMWFSPALGLVFSAKILLSSSAIPRTVFSGLVCVYLCLLQCERRMASGGWFWLWQNAYLLQHLQKS